MSKIGNMCNLIKDIIGYECIYEIDTNGIVYGKERKVKKWDGERLIKKAIKTQEISREGYARVSLFKNGISKKMLKYHVFLTKCLINLVCLRHFLNKYWQHVNSIFSPYVELLFLSLLTASDAYIRL